MDDPGGLGRQSWDWPTTTSCPPGSLPVSLRVPVSLPLGILFSVDYVESRLGFGLSSFPVSISVCLLYPSASGCLFLLSNVSPSRSLNNLLWVWASLSRLPFCWPHWRIGLSGIK